MANILSFVDESKGTSDGVIDGPFGKTVDAVESGSILAYER